ncbi:SDR family oxidoreductase [Flavobacterium sp. RSP49]|uniref:SDR family oxidoreductase n=1 Tax=Flavobacterium sp. RSP49 TaxID=2497487 RepID=UPI000F846559|nr:SDR family oxidoreductase [Flavobacterium sp. RSP49]RTZ01203.1 SDR family oxidoreductase [Flavobacterium sp. RSP49]
MHFKNKVVWITGASSGIGRELAVQLSKQEAILILTSSNENLLKELALVLKKHNSVCHILSCDLMNVDAIPELVNQAIALEGKIDVIIQCAGISQRALSDETSIEVNRKLMELNFFAPILLTQAILPHFKKVNSGNITVISSLAGLMGFPLRSGYAASKHALKGYFETMQCELYKTNISISIVYPGRIDTDISKNALLGNGNQYGKTDDINEVGIDVRICAKKIISGIQSNKKNIIIAKAERLLFWFWWFLPSIYYKIAYLKGIKNKTS